MIYLTNIFSSVVTSLVGDVDNGRGYTCTQQEIYGKFLYLPLHLTVSRKLPFFFFEHLDNPLWSEQWIWDHFSPVQGPSLKSESEVAQSCPPLCDPMDVAYKVPSSMEFSRQEYWSGLPFPSPGNLPDPGTEPGSPALQTGAFTV